MRFHIHFNFSQKLFVYFALISIIPVLVLGLISYTISIRLSLFSLEKHTQSALNTAQSDLYRCLDEYCSALDFFCKDNSIISILDSSAPKTRSNEIYQKIYIMLTGRQQTAAQMHIIKADGTFSLSTSQIPDSYNIKHYANWGIYRVLNGTNRSILYSNNFKSSTGHKFCVSVAHTIIKDHTVIGYAIIDLPSVVFSNVLRGVNTEFPTTYTVFDSYYYLLYSQNSSNIFLDYNLRLQMQKLSSKRLFYQDSTKQLIVWSKSSFGDYPITVMASASYATVLDSTSFIMATALCITLITILILLILSPMIVRSLTKPLNKIVNTMRQVQEGNTLARVSIKTRDEFGFIGTNLNKTLDTIDQLYQTNMEKQDSLRIAELKSLFSQINPHFLYNTLDSIKWLAKLNHVEDIVVIVSQLGHLLKYNINNNRNLVPLSDEITLVQSYIAIQKIRYGDRFEVTYEIDDDIQQYIIPKLILQPLVENAITHGIENKINKTHLKVMAFYRNNSIVLEVCDDGIGMLPEKLQEVKKDLNEKSQRNIGLSNVNKRVKLYFGSAYGISINSEENAGTVVDVILPIINPLAKN